MTGAARETGPIAVTGMSGRFPGATSVAGLWSMLMAGTEAVRRFSPAELRSAGVAEELIDDPGYVPCAADLAGIEDFDASFFRITPAEARLIDPQHRIFLECVWAALEDAGVPPSAHGGRVGVFGSTSLSSYLLHHVLPSAEFRGQAFTYPVLLGNDKDFLATRVSYALDLRGPSVTVQSACSSSLVAVDQACAALRSGRCDVAVAGGVSVFTPQTVGYRYEDRGTYARDGHCRPFDAAASGMVRGSGCGVVVLKRLDDALADRDRVHALIAGSAVNNDGATKAGYSAPGAGGQEEVIVSCLDACGVPASSVGYVEAHGTGTYLGDPIEVAALRRAYERTGDPPGDCALGSIKANIGHLDAAAGVTGLIKAILVLRHQTIPPQINFSEPNPEIRLPDTPFTVHPNAVRPTDPLRAASVTSLGIGGTNAHCLLTPAPPPPARGTPPADRPHTLTLSAPDGERLRDLAADLLAHLAQRPDIRLDDLAYTLAHGRPRLRHRATVTASDLTEAVAGLRAVCEGRPAEPSAMDAGADGAVSGDWSTARKIQLPGQRLRRIRHWVELERTSAARPADGGAGGRDRGMDPAEAATEVFRNRLGVEPVELDDDYFLLGGDSLTAVGAAAELARRLDAPLTLEHFLSLRTPRRIASWYTEHAGARRTVAEDGADTDDSLDDGTAELVKQAQPGADDPPVFLIHPSGGTVSFACALAARSTYPGPMYAIGYPAALLDTLTTVPSMARHYLQLVRRVRPHGPYRLGGYSLGGTVALEMARLLAGANERVERVLLFDTLPPARRRALTDREFRAAFPALLRLMFQLPEPGGTGEPATADEAIASVRQPGWTEATVRHLRTMYDVWRVCDRALAEHQPRPYDGPVHLFRAREPLPRGARAALPGAANGSDAVAGDIRERPAWTGDLRMTTVAGHHFSMFDGVHLPALTAAYDQALVREAAPRKDRAAAPSRPGAGRGGVALVFPGQGTQYAGMGRQLLARHPRLVREADDILGYSVADVCAGDPVRPLASTAYAQPALYVVGALALREHLESTGERPVAVLGHSLGEYNALEAAGVFGFAMCLRLVAARAAAMARIEGGGMLAVSGLPEPTLRALLDGAGPEHDASRVELAACNAPLEHTLAGPLGGLDRVTPVLLAHGARSVRRLNVSGPFHSRLMRPAAEEFRSRLAAIGPRPAAAGIPVIANSTGTPHEPHTVLDELIAQVDHPVRWRCSVERVIAEHDPQFREIGGRRVLTPLIGLVREAMETTGGGPRPAEPG